MKHSYVLHLHLKFFIVIERKKTNISTAIIVCNMYARMGVRIITKLAKVSWIVIISIVSTEVFNFRFIILVQRGVASITKKVLQLYLLTQSFYKSSRWTKGIFSPILTKAWVWLVLFDWTETDIINIYSYWFKKICHHIVFTSLEYFKSKVC